MRCVVFAYGATGAGKTFTMLGSPAQPGIVFHTMVDLYNRVEQLREEKTCEIAVCYVEVYNEQIRDLLATSGYLPIRDDPQKGSVITGLTFHKVCNYNISCSAIISKFVLIITPFLFKAGINIIINAFFCSLRARRSC